MKIVKYLLGGTYGIDDVVAVFDNDHKFSPTELDSTVFSIETIPDLTTEEKNLLLMNDDAVSNYSAISQLATFRSISTSFDNTKMLHKRKYQYVTRIQYKDNAQVNDG